jgi:hypothetical protein
MRMQSRSRGSALRTAGWTRRGLVLVAVFLTSIVVATGAPQHSTTGPTPPPSVTSAEGGVQPAVAQSGAVGEVVVPGVPAYQWHDGCGPTAVGMVLGYYDSHGWDALIPGDASTETPAVDQVIASHDVGSGAQHYEDYALPMDDPATNPGGPLLDRSSIDPGACHLNDSVADFMQTSWSADVLYYGWSYSNMIGPAFTGYVDSAAPQYAPTTADYYMGSTLTWTLVKGEIDAGRPLVFLVDSSQDAQPDHFVTVVGYRTSGGYDQYGFWDTWDTTLQWANFRTMSSSYPWGVWGATTFHLAAPVALTAPNGGEDWISGKVQTITWTPGIGDVKLEVSRDGGASWDIVVPATPNDGSYDWAVTGPASSQVLARVTTLAFTGSDVSDAPFTVTVPADANSPVTTVAGADALWHKAPVTLTFTASDTESGVMYTEYAIDGGSLQRGDQAVVSGQGVHTITYYSVDNAGHTETPAHTCTVKIDALGPQTTAYATSVYRGHAVTLRYRVADLTPKATVTLRIRTLGGATRKTVSLGLRWTNHALGYRYVCGLARGTYRYYVYARDQAGNVQRRLGCGTLRVR